MAKQKLEVRSKKEKVRKDIIYERAEHSEAHHTFTLCLLPFAFFITPLTVPSPNMISQSGLNVDGVSLWAWLGFLSVSILMS
jgi:hypothetical protein